MSKFSKKSQKKPFLGLPPKPPKKGGTPYTYPGPKKSKILTFFEIFINFFKKKFYKFKKNKKIFYKTQKKLKKSPFLGPSPKPPKKGGVPPIPTRAQKNRKFCIFLKFL
jgi:hypothetical protein